jgi:glycosyltransferase involved in cell wall biosynthesis
MKISVKSLYLNSFSDRLIAYVALRLIKNFNDENVTASIMGITSSRHVDVHKKIQIQQKNGDRQETEERVIYRDAVPRFLSPVLYRLLTDASIKKIVEWRFFLSVNSEDIVYLYPGCSVSLYHKLKKKGCCIVVERINTLRANSKKILDIEYRALGLQPSHGISESSALEEIRALHLADYIFSPSPAVTESIENAGIASEKTLSTSYGLEPEDILDVSHKKFESGPVTIIFVGSICVRKGVHLLLEAWNSAKIDGKLTLVGKIDPDFEQILARYQRTNIEHHPFVDDLKPIYQAADIFVLPSLEEGSPLVTYLALGASLPMIVSPMGGGGIIQHGDTGIVIDPHDKKEFSEALKLLAGDAVLREKMSLASGRIAHNFTWKKVAARRKYLLLSKTTKAIVSQQ